MKEKFRSILWQELNLTVGALRIHDISLHRHLPETTSLGMHRHKQAQFLLYLSGHGIQQVESCSHQVSAGTFAALPARVPHAFQKTGKQSALCLVIDFSIGRAGNFAPLVTELTALDLGGIRETLARIAHLRKGSDLPWEVQRATLALRLMDALLTSTRWFGDTATEMRSPIIRKVEKLLCDPSTDENTLRQIAKKTGYQPEYLNRVIKAETGLTFGQWRSRERINRAKTRLRESASIGDAAAEIGFLDQNYFARWFKEQTGMTPSAWKHSR